MAVLTGAHGALTYQGQTVAHCRSWSLDISKDALETTCLGTHNRVYIEGLRGATGSAVVFYDPLDTDSATLLNRIFLDDAAADGIGMVLDTRAGGKKLEFEALITSASTPMNTGEAVAVTIGLQVTGPITGGF
jgi:hypothetical protein